MKVINLTGIKMKMEAQRLTMSEQVQLAKCMPSRSVRRLWPYSRDMTS